MTTEENKRMLALSYMVADLKAENMELVERVHQLVDDYNDVVRQLNGKETHKDEDPAKLLLGNMQNMREHCDHPESENNGLDRVVKAMREFVIDKNLYVKKNNECPYRPGGIRIGSFRCLGCTSCLSVIKGHGVICEKRLAEANVSILSL